jgi:hypothetical protein
MTADQKRVAVIAGVLVAVIAGFLLLAPAREQVRPRPRAAHVAIEVEGEGVARTGGRVELTVGARFTLHAVLEAEDWRGRTLYYTEAKRLEIDGDDVSPDRLRRWGDGLTTARVLWFSVEGEQRYREVAMAEELSPPAFREVFRPDWPQAWSAPGSVRPSFAETELRVTGVPWPDLGTLRYHVRVELYGPESRIRPRERFSSTGADGLPEAAPGYATVTVAAPGRLSVPTRRLGLPQIEPLGDLTREAQGRLLAWTESELAFSRIPLLRLHVKAAGSGWDQLAWRTVELDGSAEWGEPGDLIQAGSRVVVAFEDRGVPDRLDGEDLALDYDRGGSLVPLKTIFPGEGLVERAALGPPASGNEGD